jgi:hypothetical protein
VDRFNRRSFRMTTAREMQWQIYFLKGNLSNVKLEVRHGVVDNRAIIHDQFFRPRS